MTLNVTNEFELKSSAEQCLNDRNCRFCGTLLEDVVVDLGLSPLCENLVHLEDLNKPETFFPLKAFVCRDCWLVQVHEHVGGEEIFSHYPYFSSNSTSFLKHAEQYAEMITERLGLDESSQVIEIASNDGYLLKNFVANNIPALGIEPAANVAQEAIKKGIKVCIKFFGVQTAKEVAAEGTTADLMVANNVIAHVPDLNDFVGGFKVLLKPTGVVTVEIPHLLNTIELNQFDTIYQEHYCYFSLSTLRLVFEKHGMKVFDVEEVPTHGGSIRVYACHDDNDQREVSQNVIELCQREEDHGLTDMSTYQEFAKRVAEIKWSLVEFLTKARREGKRVAGYGAPGKANTLLNYCGIREDLLDYTVDRNTMKQKTFLPGTRIPVYEPDTIRETQPDYVLILPWNLKDEIMEQMSYIREWGGKFVVPIPELQIYE